MKNLNSNHQLPKPRRLLTLGKRRFDQSAVTVRKLDSKGKLHAVGEPALRFDDGAEEHWVHGRLQSTDDKAALYVHLSNACQVKAVSWNDSREHEELDLTPFTHVWCDDGFIHRVGAPAVINYGDEEDALEEWWQHGLRHRVGGPAVEAYNVCKWFQHGLLHREDGPAIDYGSERSKLLGHSRRYFPSGWYWRGQLMYCHAKFVWNFNYNQVPPEFVLRVLAYAYGHWGAANATPEATARASIIFPELQSFLKTAEVIGMTGEDVAQRINDVIAGRETCEVYAVEDLVDFEPW
jgi:hypothetical protein